MGTKASAGKAESADATPTAVCSFDEFRDAVKFVLVNTYETPDIVVKALLADDEQYLKASWEEAKGASDAGAIAIKAADELALKPHSGKREWVRATDNTILVEANAATKQYLVKLADCGLYGEDVDAVASSLLVRGIECVLHFSSNSYRR